MSKRAGRRPKEPRESKNCAETRIGLSSEPCVSGQDERLGRQVGG